MKIVFRVDASIEMGIGHVMRCLTLADALRKAGARCYFVCREHPGNLISQIVAHGHKVCSLPLDQTKTRLSKVEDKVLQPAHAHWLSCDWRTDARQTSNCISSLNIDWLIIDHYALDERWEKKLRAHCRKIMVIDDLADRNHDCDLLLDQTFGRLEKDYQQRVPVGCKVLTGSNYALLRPEFATLRQYSLERRTEPRLEHLLIAMGGVDKDNVTGQVLQVLQGSCLPDGCHITVVLGKNAPWLESVKIQAKVLPWQVEVKSDVVNMAKIMSNSDLAIGAAGSTSWERCCLGLPTLMLVVAENQRAIARTLSEARAVWIFDCVEQLRALVELSMEDLRDMSRAARGISDGLGTIHVVSILTET